MKPHRTDMVSLIFALIFLALAGWWFAARLLEFSLPSMAWLGAGALVVVGLLGVIGALTAPRRRGAGRGSAAGRAPGRVRRRPAALTARTSGTGATGS